MVQYKYISADNHLDSPWLPKDLWQKGVSSKFKARAPRVVETDKGTWWMCEGTLMRESADGKDNARWRMHRFGKAGVETPEGSLPPSTPALCLEHQAMAGIYAAVIYGDTRRWPLQDLELRNELNRAKNDFLLALSEASDYRLLYLPDMPVWSSPQDCVAEMRRVIHLGARAVEFSIFDTVVPLWHPDWEPFWTAAEDSGISIGCHIGDRAGTPYPPNEYGRSLAHFSYVGMTAPAPAIAQLVFSGVLERHPGLHVSFGECQVTWLPYLIATMDLAYRVRGPDPTAPLSMPPGEYFKRQVTFTFDEDPIAGKLLRDPDLYLQDCAVFGADYPHKAWVWPKVDEFVDRILAEVDPAVKHTLVFQRCAERFKIDVSKLNDTQA